jgi:hypothetical protein
MLCIQSSLGGVSIPGLIKCRSLPASELKVDGVELAPNKKLLLFIFDFNDFMCMNCLESFLSFCQSIPTHILEENVWGILTIGSEIRKSGSKDYLKVTKAKLRGFVRANRIPFPIFIDEFQIFRQFQKKGSSVLLFDASNDILKEYIFPLTKNQIGEIQEIMSGL